MALEWTNRINDVDDVDAGDVNSLASAIIDIENGKVDKITGKGLSTNDYTTAEKEKLEDLENYDDTAVRTDISNLQTGLGAVIQGKQDKEAGKGLSTNDYTTAEKNMLQNVYNTAVRSSQYIGQFQGGIVKANSVSYASDATSDGQIFATVLAYSDYASELSPLTNNAFVSVGTLRNVIQSELKPLILQYSDMTGYTLNMLQRYNHDIRFTTIPLTILQIQFSEGVYALDYIMSFNFNSGTTPTDIVYANTGTELQISTIINWVGTDCGLQNGVSTFTPQANKHYEVMIWFNGTDFTGSVIGYEQANANPASDTSGLEPDEPTPNPSDLEFE